MADSEDDEFSIIEGGTLTQTGMSTLVNNLPHDEEVELSDDSQEDVSNVDDLDRSVMRDTNLSSPQLGDSPPNEDHYANGMSPGSSRRIDEDYGHEDDEGLGLDDGVGMGEGSAPSDDGSAEGGHMDAGEGMKINPAATVGRNMPTLDLGGGGADAGNTGGDDADGMMQGGNGDDLDGEDGEDGTSAGGGGGAARVPKYNPEDYAHLNEQVNNEIISIFDLIDRFKPQQATLETRLKCFIPEYMPAMGDVDEFIKVARPDGRVDESGLRTLDEPCIDQSDTAVLNLRLRQSSKHVGSQPVEVASVSDPSKSHQRIAAWMKSIEEIHKHRRTGGIGGLGDGTGAGGADIEGMMSEWPNEEIAVKMRNAANKIGGCDALSIGEVARVMCALLDIPVKDATNVVEPLHVMMSLYLSFKNNPIYNPPTDTEMA